MSYRWETQYIKFNFILYNNSTKIIYTKSLIMNFLMKNKLVFFAISLILISGLIVILLIQNYSNLTIKTNIEEKNSSTINRESGSINQDIKIYYTYRKIYKIKSGQTFSNFLNQFKLDANEKSEIINLVSKEIDLYKIKIDTKIEVNFNTEKKFDSLIIFPNKEKEVHIVFSEGEYRVKTDVIKVYKSLILKEATVKNSIYQSLTEKGVPENTIMDFIRLFSFDIDFQREIRNENKIKIFYEVYKDQKQNYITSGKISFAEIKLHNNTYQLYRFTNEKGDLIDYFDENGKSATKALMKTPIDGARLSSGFGIRKHPILGYNRKHKGVDFAAPKGTPIMAAGTGYIEFIGTNGGAGKYIRIKHLNGYKTSYSHISKYASGMKKGFKVNQGQVIAFVGTTGLSTGPHLHYEVWFNNKRINPMTMQLPSGIKLNDSQLFKFKKIKEDLDLGIKNYIN